MSTMLEAMNWRYATQQFDTTKKVTPEQLQLLEEATRLSASSFGLQPYKVIVVTNPAVREQLKVAAWGQPKITDASHLFVFAARTNVDLAYVEQYFQLISATRNIPVESLQPLRDMMTGFVTGKSKEALTDWATRQAYIALGTLLVTAAHEHIDAGPMEGFDPKKFDEILGLAAMNLESKVAVAVGFRSADDKMATMAKVRFPASEFFVEVK